MCTTCGCGEGNHLSVEMAAFTGIHLNRWCETCQQYVTLLTQRVRRCPQCHGDMLQIVADDGLQIRRIEIDQE